jgi:hypothetical protein
MNNKLAPYGDFERLICFLSNSFGNISWSTLCSASVIRLKPLDLGIVVPGIKSILKSSSRFGGNVVGASKTSAYSMIVSWIKGFSFLMLSLSCAVPLGSISVVLSSWIISLFYLIDVLELLNPVSCLHLF